MSTENGIDGVKNFLNEHLVKVLWAISLYFIMGLSNDFKDVKITLQQLLINQATMEARMGNVESMAKQNAIDITTLRDKTTISK